MKNIYLLCLFLIASLPLFAQSGAIDTTFHGRAVTPLSGSRWRDMALLPDGKILLAGVYAGAVMRLNPDGSVDRSFVYDNEAFGYEWVDMYKMLVQSTGKIILLGSFRAFNGMPYHNIVRLNADGTLDNTFRINVGVEDTIADAKVQPDDKILISGAINTLNGVKSTGLVRLNADGSPDYGFHYEPEAGYSGAVGEIYLRPRDGKIHITVPTRDQGKSLRLNADGSIDKTFAPTHYTPIPFLVQPDGRYYSWNTDYGVRVGPLLRYHPDGRVDNTFARASMRELVLQPDGKVVFVSLPDEPRSFGPKGLGRLNPDGSLDNTFPLAECFGNQFIGKVNRMIS